jgi:hypothetical protein
MADYRLFFKTLGHETFLTSRELLKITIPVVIITKIMEEAGFVVHLSNLLEPVMVLVGLPGALGLVWATAILSNLYGAMMVFAALAPGLHLTIAQTTTLCSLMLIAHSLPLELSISRKAGAGFGVMGVLRLTGALLFGFLLHIGCTTFNIGRGPAILLFKGQQKSSTLAQWGLSQIQNLLLLVAVVFCIIVIMRFLRASGFLTMLEQFLAPALPFLGMSRQAAPLTVVGMLMGISYGGALIIRETSTGRLEHREIFYSLALMGLSHSLVEDTLLMMAMGGSLIGILWGRLLFSLVVIFLLVRMMGWSEKNVKHECNGHS